jgi:hypothetical protein|tara:strand:+ start:770 stop:1021 length:252 start_codon:yes stop_codon:yes gene_type:complete
MNKKKKATDRGKVISWLKEDLEYYKNNIGEVKNYGKTLRGMANSTTIITQKLIDDVTERIEKLEEMELENEKCQVNRKEYQEV